MTHAPPPPGPHGGDGAAIARWLGVEAAQVLDLSASLNPFGPDVAAVVRTHADAVRRYGDVAVGEANLAAAMGIDPDLVVLTHGGSEAIALVAALHPAGRVDDPEFSLYRRHLDEVRGDAPRWRSNPHSPSGRLAAPTEQAAVWDEAFWPLTTGTWTRGDHRHGSTVVGSLTKLFACPGLRLGYVVASGTDEAAALRARRPEWAVGALALDVLHHLVDELDLATTARAASAARRDLVVALSDRGWNLEVGDAPWVLVHPAHGLRDALARRGVAVRDCASFGLPDAVRIAVPDGAGLDRLCSTLDEIGLPA